MTKEKLFLTLLIIESLVELAVDELEPYKNSLMALDFLDFINKQSVRF